LAYAVDQLQAGST